MSAAANLKSCFPDGDQRLFRYSATVDANRATESAAASVPSREFDHHPRTGAADTDETRAEERGPGEGHAHRT